MNHEIPEVVREPEVPRPRDRPKPLNLALPIAITISLTAHAAALVLTEKWRDGSLLELFERKKEKPALILPSAKPPHVAERTTAVDPLKIKTITEQEFEKLVKEKIAFAKLQPKEKQDKIIQELIAEYTHRLKRYQEELFEAVRHGGMYTDRYADFLIKTDAYHTTLDMLREGRLEFLSVSGLRDQWEEIVSQLRQVLQDIDPDADELARINALQKALVRQRILRGYNEPFARFHHILKKGKAKGKANCSGISYFNMALVAELLPHADFRYRSFVLHLKTAYHAKDGTIYVFENTSWSNQGRRLVEDDKGLSLPKEVLIAGYLMNNGYRFEDFARDIQEHWFKQEGYAVATAINTDDLFMLPDRGYCEGGELSCSSPGNTSYDFEEQMLAELEEKEQSLEQKSLAQILDADFFAIDDNFLPEKPDDPEAVAVTLPKIRFFIDPEKLRKVVAARLKNQEGLDQLSRLQLTRLYQFFMFGDGIHADFRTNIRFAENDIKRAMAKVTKEKDIQRILALQEKYERLRAIWEYVKYYHDLPLPFAKLVAADMEFFQRGGGGEGDFFETIHSMEADAFRLLVQVPSSSFQIGLTQFPQELAEAMKSLDVFPKSFSLPKLTLDADAARRLTNTFHGDALVVGSVHDVEAARELVQFQGKLLVINDCSSLTPDIAREIIRFKGDSLGLNHAESLSPQTLEVLVRFPGQHLYFFYSETIPQSHPVILAQFSGYQLDLSMKSLFDAAIIEALEKARAKNVEIMHVEDISDEAARRLAQSKKVTSSALREEAKLRLQKYSPSSSEILTKIGPLPSSFLAHIFYEIYGRTNPILAADVVRQVGESNNIGRFYFVTLDAPTVDALKAAIDENPRFGIVLPKGSGGFSPPHFYILDLPPDAAEAIAKIDPHFLSIHFYNEISIEALQKFVAGRRGKAMDIGFGFRPQPEHLRLIATHDGILDVHFKYLTPDIPKELKRYRGPELKITVEQPVGLDFVPLVRHLTEHGCSVRILSDNFEKPAFTEETAAEFGLPSGDSGNIFQALNRAPAWNE